jgi:hypothetical protein
MKHSLDGLYFHNFSIITFDFLCCFSNLTGIFGETYEICLEQIKRQYVTATALASMFGTSSLYACAIISVLAVLHF